MRGPGMGLVVCANALALIGVATIEIEIRRHAALCLTKRGEGALVPNFSVELTSGRRTSASKRARARRLAQARQDVQGGRDLSRLGYCQAW